MAEWRASQGRAAAMINQELGTGWRTRSEVLGLRLDQVDFVAGVVRLEPSTTKSGKGRTFSFDILPEAAELLKQRRAETNTVIAATGRRVPTVFRRGWASDPLQEVAEGVAGGLHGGGSRRSTVARLPADSRAEPAAGRRGRRHDHEALRMGYARDVRPLQHRRRARSACRRPETRRSHIESHSGSSAENTPT